MNRAQRRDQTRRRFLEVSHGALGTVVATHSCERCGAPLCLLCGVEATYCDGCNQFHCELCRVFVIASSSPS